MPDPLKREEEPPSRHMKRYWKIAVLANIKDDDHPKPEGVPPDAFADFDHIETVNSLRAALETDGHSTVFIQADSELPYALREEKPDIYQKYFQVQTATLIYFRQTPECA